MIGDFLTGQHRSIRPGQGLEFRQYRTYQPGDDLRNLDWKLYARSDRFYIKESEIESNIRVRFVLDASASMRHEDHHKIDKISFARLIIAALAYLSKYQGDSIGLFAWNDKQLYQVPVESRRGQFQRFLHELIQIQAQGKFPVSQVGEVFSDQKRQKEMIIVLTDLYQHQEEWQHFLKQLRGPRHEIIVFHLMAQNEMQLDYPRALTFEDWETGERVPVDPKLSRQKYRGALQVRLKKIREDLLGEGIFYELALMQLPLNELIQQFLLRRKLLL
ncbi:MAG: DUF58 domain-containing protein [Bacteroidota bacterium]